MIHSIKKRRATEPKWLEYDLRPSADTYNVKIRVKDADEPEGFRIVDSERKGPLHSTIYKLQFASVFVDEMHMLRNNPMPIIALRTRSPGVIAMTATPLVTSALVSRRAYF